ncbi:MAG: BamA/TamA family outer membrane protein [Vicinamibacterales bacterium]
MKHAIARFILVLLMLPVAPAAAGPSPAGQRADPNVNRRYDVESVSITGISESRLSVELRADIQRLVGAKYDPEAVRAISSRIRNEVGRYYVAHRVRRGERVDHVKVVFDVRPKRSPAFDSRLPPLVYHSYEGFSGALVPGFETHHNYFSGGIVSNSDELLERFAGVRFRYEHRRVGTERLQVGIQYDLFHPSFKREMTTALERSTTLPGTYRTRHAFAPEVSVFPVPQVKLTFGGSFQNLEFHERPAGQRHAYAWAAGAHVREVVRTRGNLRHGIGLDYGVRVAATALQSDFAYTRHTFGADYSLSAGRHGFAASVLVGRASGTAPLFERFSLGNSSTLRGWNKFDVAPLGGNRLAHASLEYKYRPFRVFYDLGSVWDAAQTATLRHAVGLGVGWRNGAFLTIGFPVRVDRVRPVVMFGFRG